MSYNNVTAIDILNMQAMLNEQDRARRRTREDQLGDAEDRALVAEIQKKQLSEKLNGAQEDNDAARLAIKLLIARNGALERSMRHLAEKWAKASNRPTSEVEALCQKEVEESTKSRLTLPQNQPLFEQDISRAIEAQRPRVRRRR